MDVATVTSIINTGLLILFLVLLVLFIYFSISIVYHWGYYSFNVQAKRIAQGLYFFVSIVTLVLLLLFIGMYIFNYGF